MNTIQEKDKIIISKPKKKHKTLEERFEMFEKLSSDEKGHIEKYDWGDNFEEIIDIKSSLIEL